MRKLLLWAVTSAAGFGLHAQNVNCTFRADPDAFLNQQIRANRAIHERVVALDKAQSALAAPIGTVDAASIPHQNFIDDEIFNAMAKMRVPSAPLSTDEEFFRRITLDLTGRIPSSADVRAFSNETNPSKRKALIDKLLYSNEFVDKWTMWLGDLLQNNITSVTSTRQVNGRNAMYQWIWSSVLGWVSLKDISYTAIAVSGNNYDRASAAGFLVNGQAPGGPVQDRYDMMLVKSATAFLGLGHYDCLLCHSGRGRLDALSLWGATASRTQAQQMAAFFSKTILQGYIFPAGTALADQQANYYYQSVNVSDGKAGTYSLPTAYGNRPNRLLLGTKNTVDPVYRTGATPGDLGWRSAFAENMIQDPMFAVNWSNRLWKQMFNLGLVDTADTLDPARLDPSNPPTAPWTFQATHPVLLDRLAKEFVARDYSLRETLRLIAESSAYQLSSRYPGNWSLDYVPLFARHYPRRLDAEEIHDAIAKSTGVFTKYTIRGWADPVVWAMQVPDTTEPAGTQAASFMSYFLRGNRDTLPRSRAATILQSSALMNDPFVTGKFHMTQSPALQAVAKLATPAAQLEELFLTFLGRMPTDFERSKALAYLTAGTTTAQKNAALEDLAWALINKLDFQFSY